VRSGYLWRDCREVREGVKGLCESWKRDRRPVGRLAKGWLVCREVWEVVKGL